MKYSIKFFKESLPEWKRKKDPILSRIFYRPFSFCTAALCANMGISANTVSYTSCIVAVLGCALFLVDNYWSHIVGAILFNVWLVMDCTDGNLARAIKKQPFGEFADAASSYLLVGLMGVPMGVAVFQDGGAIIEAGCYWIIVIGALASSSDSLMRLIYQKYVNIGRKMSDEGFMEPEVQKQTLPSEVGSLRVRIDAELGIGGMLPFFILLATIFGFLDIAVMFCFLYYGGCALVMTISYMRKAIRHTAEWEAKQLH